MVDLSKLTAETRQMLYKMVREAPKVEKAISLSTTLYGYNLEGPAHQLVPLMSDFSQSIPRKTMPGSSAVNWKQITALSSPKLSTTENTASNPFTTTVTPKSAAYKVHGLRGEVSREAEAASEGFDDALDKETINTLANAMKLFEQYQLGGNITTLGTAPTPVLAEVNGVGTIGAVTVYAMICALTLPAANRESIDFPADYSGGNALLAGAGARHTSIKPIADGWTAVSTEANSGAMTGTDNGVHITWAPVAGAAAYAVFAGTSTGAANLKCEAIVTQCAVTLTSLNGTGAAASTVGADTSADANTFDGIIPQLFAAGSGAYLKNVAGVLSASGGEITQIQDMFASLYSSAKLADFRLLVDGSLSRVLTKKGITSDSIRFNVSGDASGRMEFTQGAHIGSIMNQTKGTRVPIETLPWLPGGMVIALPTAIPYNDANVNVPFDMVMGYDWERWDYASTVSTGPVYPFETRCWGVLRGLFTGGCGILYNIFKG